MPKEDAPKPLIASDDPGRPNTLFEEVDQDWFRRNQYDLKAVQEAIKTSDRDFPREDGGFDN